MIVCLSIMQICVSVVKLSKKKPVSGHFMIDLQKYGTVISQDNF